jgi:hypothetical protein
MRVSKKSVSQGFLTRARCRLQSGGCISSNRCKTFVTQAVFAINVALQQQFLQVTVSNGVAADGVMARRASALWQHRAAGRGHLLV